MPYMNLFSISICDMDEVQPLPKVARSVVVLGRGAVRFVVDNVVEHLPHGGEAIAISIGIRCISQQVLAVQGGQQVKIELAVVCHVIRYGRLESFR